jgi:hypothetical protein
VSQVEEATEGSSLGLMASSHSGAETFEFFSISKQLNGDGIGIAGCVRAHPAHPLAPPLLPLGIGEYATWDEWSDSCFRTIN